MDFSPRQQEYLKNYLDPKSKNFGNSLQSALAAGYSQEYSESIIVQEPDWLRDALGKSRKVIKAEHNLDLALDGLLDDPEKGKKEIQWKATEFSLKTLRKDEYSERSELTGKDGKDLPTPILHALYHNDSNKEDNEVIKED